MLYFLVETIIVIHISSGVIWFYFHPLIAPLGLRMTPDWPPYVPPVDPERGGDDEWGISLGVRNRVGGTTTTSAGACSGGDVSPFE